MMGGRSWDEWVDEYSDGHQHPVNKLMHTFGIPMIVLSLVLIIPSFFISGLWRFALGLFVVGLLAKPMVLTLPIVLLLIDVWPLGRLRLRRADWFLSPPGNADLGPNPRYY